jgi:aminoglycoside phosphotransferase (APT) family kinase protein
VPLLASGGTAVIEGWCHGRRVPRRDVDAAREAGAMLGALHRTVEPEDVGADDPRLHFWLRQLASWIGNARRAGLLSEGDALRVRDRTRALRPSRATWGLRHGDFSADNLVVGEKGLCCVDNTTIGVHFLERDLAQTFYRWPMSASVRRAFLAGYDRAGGACRFLENEEFWMISATVRAVGYRLRRGMSDLETPLRALRRHALDA